MRVPLSWLREYAPLADSVPAAEVARELTAAGLPGRRAETVRAVARAVAAGQLSLDPGPAPAETLTRLLQVPGVGEWTAQYIVMRAARWPDAFPHGDLGLKKGIGEMSAGRLLGIAEAWRPWRAYAAMHIWQALSQVNQKGAVRA